MWWGSVEFLKGFLYNPALEMSLKLHQYAIQQDTGKCDTSKMSFYKNENVSEEFPSSFLLPMSL